MRYEISHKQEIRPKDLNKLDQESKEKLLDILGIPNEINDYVISINLVEYWDNK